MRRRQVTLRQVAVEAGVSAPTVSRVLNRHSGVNDDVRKRVFETIERLGYNAEPITRKAVVISRANVKTKLLEVILFPLPEQNDMFRLTYFNDIYAGIQSFITQAGMTESALSTWNSAWKSIADLPESLMKRFKQVDGLLLIGSVFPKQIGDLKKLNRSIVLIGSNPETSNTLDFVSHNDFQAGQTLADHLIAKGCRDIGFFSGSRISTCFESRLNGVMVRVFHKLGPDHFSFRYADSTDASDVMAAATAWLESGSLPKTVITSHFEAAYTFYNLFQRKLADPSVYNIATFDALSGFIPEFEFTCMETYPKQLGIKAAQRVLQMIDSPHTEDMPQTIMVPCHLVEGNSVN